MQYWANSYKKIKLELITDSDIFIELDDERNINDTDGFKTEEMSDYFFDSKLNKEYKPTPEKQIASNNITDELKPIIIKKRKNYTTAQINFFIKKSLIVYKSRMQDLDKIQKYYNELAKKDRIQEEGYRYNMCYIVFKCAFNVYRNKNKALNIVYEFNKEFFKPLLEEEINRKMKSIKDNISLKTNTILDLLHLDDSILEQIQTKALRRFSESDKKHYKEEYNKEYYRNILKKQGKVLKKDQITEDIDKVKTYIAEGKKQKEIAKLLNTSTATISRYVQKIKNQELS